MARGIIGIDDNESTSARGDRLLQSVEINLPSVVVQQWIADELYVVNIRQKTKERITGLGYQKLVTRIAKKAKRKRVGFAGAGGEDYVFRGNRERAR